MTRSLRVRVFLNAYGGSWLIRAGAWQDDTIDFRGEIASFGLPVSANSNSFKKRFLDEGTLESIDWNRLMASIYGCFKRFIRTEKYRIRTIIDQFRRTGVDVGFKSRTNAKQDERQIACPMFSFILSHEGGLQCSMEALNHPIGRGMVRSCADSLASKKLAHLLKKSWF